jgi:hypothetical protein
MTHTSAVVLSPPLVLATRAPALRPPSGWTPVSNPNGNGPRKGGQGQGRQREREREREKGRGERGADTMGPSLEHKKE